MPNPPELVWLDNLTPKSTRFDDSYYSRQSGLEETRYVFIKGNQLPLRWQQGQSPVIGELGFGTGLNFLATLQAWQTLAAGVDPSHEDKVIVAQNPALSVQNLDEGDQKEISSLKKLTFVSMEKYPMNRESMARALSPWTELKSFAEPLIETWPPSRSGWTRIEFGSATLHIFLGDAQDALASCPLLIDAWYLDGFNPKTNPDLWSLELMQAVRTHSSLNATLASYTAAGWVRRNLEAAGFAVAKRKGFGHKRDMITGSVKPSLP